MDHGIPSWGLLLRNAAIRGWHVWSGAVAYALETKVFNLWPKNLIQYSKVTGAFTFPPSATPLC